MVSPLPAFATSIPLFPYMEVQRYEMPLGATEELIEEMKALLVARKEKDGNPADQNQKTASIPSSTSELGLADTPYEDSSAKVGVASTAAIETWLPAVIFKILMKPA
jgi:hypothetical protein